MLITLDLSDDHAEVLLEALDKSSADHARQASRPGASPLARRGHLHMQSDVESVRQQVMASIDAAKADEADNQADAA